MKTTWKKYTDVYPTLTLGWNDSIPGIRKGDRIKIPAGTMIYEIFHKKGYPTTKDKVVKVQYISHGLTDITHPDSILYIEPIPPQVEFGSDWAYRVDINDILIKAE